MGHETFIRHLKKILMSLSIYLRPLCIEDAQISCHWRNDPEIWKYTGQRPDVNITTEIETNWLKGTLNRKDQLRYAICIVGTDTYVGNVQLLDILNNKAELHIFIGDRAFWGKNIGYNATIQVLRLGFLKQMLSEIYLKVHTENKIAQKIYERAGFQASTSEKDLLSMKIDKARFVNLNVY